jgi:hypothetical protein
MSDNGWKYEVVDP